jgi:hypothetical protein
MPSGLRPGRSPATAAKSCHRDHKRVAKKMAKKNGQEKMAETSPAI